MAAVRDSYGNTASTGYTINWFNDCAHNARNAFLASPFFSTYKPIETLTKRGCEVSLLVRLCSITAPVVLRSALADPRVRVRYYTDRHFHAKLYIIDDTALVGSANLTEAGLMTNREVSVVLRTAALLGARRALAKPFALEELAAAVEHELAIA